MSTDGWEDQTGQGEAGPKSEAERQAANVGTALIAVVLTAWISCIGFLWLSTVLLGLAPKHEPNVEPGAPVSNAQRGREAAPCLQFVASLVYVPVLIGGLDLRKGRGRGMGRTAAVLSMLPCSIVFPIGLAVGSWALIVLARHDVRRFLERP